MMEELKTAALICPVFALFLAPSYGLGLQFVFNLLAIFVALLAISALHFGLVHFSGVQSFEVTSGGRILARTLFSKVDFAISDISRLSLGAPSESPPSYIGEVSYVGGRLVTGQLDIYEFARLGLFFRYVASIDPSIILEEYIDYLEPRPDVE